MERENSIRSISRSISVLRTINHHGSLPMMAIAREEGLPYPTAFRIVQTLVNEGLIVQEPQRKHYRATALVQSLASGYKAEGNLLDAVGLPIRTLTQQVGWPAFVTTRVGPQMVVCDATHAHTTLTFALCHPGFAVPLLYSATGQACLANADPEEADDLIRWALIGSGGGQYGDEAADLARTIQQIRALGYAAKACMNNSPNRSASIAVPILKDGQVEAVLTLVYFHSALRQSDAIDRYLGSIKATAEQISGRLVH